MYFIFFPQVPPSCSRAFAKAKLILCIIQPQITPGIRAFLILLLILVLHNWGSLQICSGLRADNRSCWEGRAFCRVWAAVCLLQLGPDPEVCSSRSTLWSDLLCGKTRNADWAPAMLWGQLSIIKVLEMEGLRWNTLPWYKGKLGAHLASRLACFQEKRFYGISRDLLDWPSLETQIREIHLWHKQDLLKAGLVVDWGQSDPWSPRPLPELL